MKNLFLTLALMCCVSFAFANEDLKDDAEKPNLEITEIQKETGIYNNSLAANYCFALSCRVHCTSIDTEAEDDQVLEAWFDFEKKWCNS